ncbi:hypothetical protein KKH43_00385 [Patescibacteria group bacterium]|nr:hypothetical protein [Patescibacteria group bacterium]
MYYYIFDQTSQKHGFQKALDKIGLKITDLELDGEKTKETITKNISLLTNEALEKDVKNIIVVGTDSSLNAVLKGIVAKKKDVALGYIPLKRSLYSELFNIPIQEHALEIISKRKIITTDLGKVNHGYFISSMKYAHSLKKSGSMFNVKSLFQIRSPENILFDFQYNDNFDLHAEAARFSIFNVVSSGENKQLREEHNVALGKRAHSDGRFDICVLSKGSSPENRTCFQATHLYVKSHAGPVTCILDECVDMRSQEFTVHVLPMSLKMIVGNATLFR